MPIRNAFALTMTPCLYISRGVMPILVRFFHQRRHRRCHFRLLFFFWHRLSSHFASERNEMEKMKTEKIMSFYEMDSN